MTQAMNGVRVLVTRARHQALDLAEKIQALGAEPVFFPAIEIAPLEDFSLLDRALKAIESYDWVVFTSANGVDSVWNRLEKLPELNPDWQKVRVAAIGPATAQALRQRGVEVDFMPARYIAEAIAEGLAQGQDIRGQRFLLLRAEIAREALAEELERLGASVENIAVYRTLDAEPDAAALRELERGVDAVTLTSSSTATSFARLVSEKNYPWVTQCAIACIGPITADTARQCGLSVDVVAEEYTAAGLVRALAAFFESKQARKSNEHLA